jgi:Tfp pilus assembly protein PilV
MAADPVTRRSPDGGFTLIEVLIAMTLTALAIMGILALYITETKASGFSRHSTEASVLAEDKIEKLRTGPPIAIAPTTETNITALDAAGGIYTRVYSQVLSAATYADVTVTVSWADDGVLHTVVMHTRRNL